MIRLREAVKKTGTQKDVAARAGIPASSLTDYLSGTELKLSVAAKLADVCGVSLGWLVSGGEDATTAAYDGLTDIDTALGLGGEAVEIRNYDVYLSAGGGADGNQTPTSELITFPKKMLPPSVLSNLKDVVTVTVRGDSMQPIIEEGDRIILRTDVDSIRSGSIYAIRIDNSLLVKRLHLKTNGNVEVVSDNPAYSPEELDAAQIRQMISDGGSPTKIIGRVVWRMGEM
ncbi:S24 family peptidase [Acetobacter sp. DsW_063]|uniref:LexA family transcriptional regulator n=1 Tax=Acetobacter sp. DsW_063 TaxID=1514894 RepID=UPI0013020CEC|nr:S24 family peptidase [Acetobacter sp. DsW_063]